MTPAKAKPSGAISRLTRALAGQGLARAAGLIRDVLLARWLGVVGVFSTYLFIFSVQSIALGLVASVATVSMVPAFSRMESSLQRRHLARMVVAAVVAAAIGLALLALTCSTWVAGAVAMMTLVPSFGSTVMASRLIVADRQLSAVVPGVALALVPVVWVRLLLPDVSLQVLVAANLLGYLLETLVLATLVLRLCDGHSSVGLFDGVHRPHVVALIAGSAISTLWVFIDLAVVRSLGDDAVGVYSLGGRVPLGIAGILLPALTAVVLPGASRVVRDLGTFSDSWIAIRRRVTLAGTAATLAAVALVLLSPPLNELLFRNSEVDAASLALITDVQRILSLTLPTFIVSTMLARYLQAAGLHALVVRLSIVSTVFNICADIGFALAFGVRGVAMASVLGYGVSALLLSMSCHRLGRRGSKLTAIFGLQLAKPYRTRGDDHQ